MKKRIDEAGIVNTLMDKINSMEDEMISKLNNASAAFQKHIESYKGDISRLDADKAEGLLDKAKVIAKSHLSVLDNIGIADIPKLEMVRVNLGMVKAGLYEMGIMVDMLNTKRKDAGFSQNALNAQTVDREKGLGKKIDKANSDIDDIMKLMAELLSDIADFNKKVQVKKYQLLSK